MKNENSRNTIIFIVCSVLILGIYWFTVLRPQAERRAAQQSAQAEQSQTAENAANTALSPQGPVFVTDRTQALGTAARVPIQSGTLRGSLSLQGARIDDLFLTDYREVQDDPAPVELFRPQGMEHAYFAQFGWAGANIPGGVPGPNTPWRLTAGSTLTPTTPITLTWDNGQGLRFTRMVSVDDKYVFTLKDTVQNLGTQPITIAPYGSVQRQGVPPAAGSSHIVHEGAIGAFGKPGEYRTEQKKYKDWLKEPRIENASTGGWLGITDKYWLAALLPQQNEAVQTEFRVRDANGGQQLEANLLGASRTIQPGATTTETQRLFAGVKRAEVLKSYEESLGLPRFVYAIDWGMFWFLTRPIFWILENVYAVVGSFGVAILALTVIVKLVMFPLANNAYASMSKMRNLQPKMEEIRKKHKDDPQKQQQEMMGLYQKEKINPVAGCLPLLLQIPVFYALYKVLTVTIEMRHQPFLGFIHDLSARDPSTIWNLFGLIPWDPSTLPVLGGLLGGPLHIGLLAIAYGLTMWLQTAMNPPATDPMQRQIFQFMPLVFTFIMAPFAAGLLVYWAWSNILTILQQYVIMHRYKAENPIDSFIGRFKKSPGVIEETEFTPEEIEAARVLFARPATFVMGAAKIEQLPDPDLPEIAFAGRSNVGKSSLINGLVGMHKLARASNEPGRTREVNFFDLDGRLRLVDLPGYGWAKASKSTTKKFQDLGRDYLRGRVTLKRVYLLIDARHGLKSVDAEALDALDLAAVSYQIVLTKADKLKKGEGEKMQAATLKAVSKRPAAFPVVALTSSEKGVGLPELRAEIMRTTGATID